MARGDTLPPARKHFAEDDAGPVDTKPQRLRYPCAAHQCPMPGTVFLGGGDGVCGWHLNENPDDWPRITQAIRDWECVAITINRARRVITAPDTCASAKAQDDAMKAEWAALRQAVLGSAWLERVKPTPGEHFGVWYRRLERFLAARVRERITGAQPESIDETKPTAFAAEVHAAIRTPSTTNPED